ncbi:DUF4249 domain-containing protein [Fulvivirgaceae bacterium BMA10]|uniref:DUF4249 domain-containing protein n=1 Tax=Splendidivirga corallicola TaxID=3051826 RepID=A0ABT8KI34_9BACT|nr:DUF4249 domain-containing protein [Fulvivirgaceae bacterium BMA10]
MTKYIHSVFTFLTMLLLTSCLEEVNESSLTGDERIVINALITNDEGPYFVRVSKSSTRLQDFTTDEAFGFIQKIDDRFVFEPVTDAIVTIQDDLGNIDILELWDETYPNAAVADSWAELGFYRTTTDLRGEPGRTYTLTVKYNGQEYKAEASMPSAPPKIDEVTFVDKILTSGQPEPFKIPVVSFDEPQDHKNYYMFFFRNHEENVLRNNLWTMLYEDFITFDDEFLKPRVENLNLDSGIEVGESLDPLFSGRDVEIEIHTLSKSAFKYYESLKEQIRNDGGTFSPAPASPPTNISNGGLGFFRVSAVNEIVVPFPED